MMQIIFKAQREDGKGWIEGDVINSVRGIFIRVDDSNGYSNSIKVKPETLCQFTGKVIKGTKLFKGDIFKVGNYFKLVSYNTERMAFAITNCDENGKIAYSFEQPQNPSEDWWNEFKEDIKIIGNIYDKKD